MNPLLTFKPYDAFNEIAATAPQSWTRSGVPLPGYSYCVMLCDEADAKKLRQPGHRRAMEKNIGCPIIPVLGDSIRQSPNVVQTMGGPPVIALDYPVPGGVWSYWPAYPGAFDGEELPRKGAIFIGRTDYPDRQKMLSDLWQIGVEIVVRNNEQRDYVSYARTLRSARAVVNMCSDRKTGKPQMKARVVEACLAGALLLEQANPLTKQWLAPGVEYLEWSNLKDLGTILTHMDRDPEWGADIARRGQAAARERLAPKHFWEMVETVAVQALGRQ